jgi:MFS family permease
MMLCFASFSAVYAPLWFVTAWVKFRFGYSSSTASSITIGLLNMVATIVTPLMGTYFDRNGRGLSAVAISFLLQCGALFLIAYTTVHPVWFVVLYAFSFSVVRYD